MLKQVSRAVVSFTLTAQLGISPHDIESEGGSVEKTIYDAIAHSAEPGASGD